MTPTQLPKANDQLPKGNLTIKKHLIFEDCTADYMPRKTKVYKVVSSHTRDEIGIITWHSTWRQYIIAHPTDYETGWSADCLNELSAFIKQLMYERTLGVK